VAFGHARSRKQAEQLIQDTINDATARGQGVGLNMM